MARVRSPSFGPANEFLRADVVESPTAKTLRTPGTNLTVSSQNDVDCVSRDRASVATFGVPIELERTPTIASAKSGRTLPSNPRGTPPRHRRKPVHAAAGGISSPSSPSSEPQFGSPISSPARNGAKGPRRGATTTSGAVDSPPHAPASPRKGGLEAWKFQNAEVDLSATMSTMHGRRRRNDFSPRRTEGAERRKDQETERNDRGRKRLTMDPEVDSTNTSSFTRMQPATHAQPAGYPVELSPQRTPQDSGENTAFTLKSTSDAHANDTLRSVPPNIALRPSSPTFGRTSPSSRENKTSLLVPLKPQVQSLQKPTQGRNQFAFIRMMEGNKAATPRPITRAEVAQHCKRSDCWMILHNKVYDVTSYLPYHPGGKAVMAQFAGKDATAEFLAAHHWVSIDSLISKLYLGPVAPDAKN